MLVTAAAATLVFQRLRLPVVMGYLLAGIAIGPWVEVSQIQTLSALGVIFLMFSLGLEFSFHRLVAVGFSPALTGLMEMSGQFMFGYGVGWLLDWPRMDRVFVGAMVAVSSTTIIVRAFDELKVKSRRFAENVVGILIVEDLAAILMIVVLTSFVKSGTMNLFSLVLTGGKLFFVVGSWFLAGYFLVPRFVRYVGRGGSEEVLTVISVALCLGLTVVADAFHYSTALGAFIMGSILAESSEAHRIEHVIHPIRDLFGAVFFVSIGMLLDPRVIMQNVGTVLLLSGVVMFGKFFFATFGSLLSGQTFRTAVQVGFSLGQIGEFSFIIVSVGIALGAVSSSLLPIAVAVSAVTAFFTPLLIRFGHTVAVKGEVALPFWLRDGLSRYASSLRSSQSDRTTRIWFYRQGLLWAINALIVALMFLIALEWVIPWVRVQWGWRKGFALGALLGILFFSGPFLWAMFTSFRRGRPILMFIARVCSVAWIGLWSARVVGTWSAVFLTCSGAILLVVLFYRRLERSYLWFQKNFQEGFNKAPKSRRSVDLRRILAPWDAHLVRIKVHPNSEIVGKTVAEAALRSKYGINVVVIQRGLKTLVAPSASEEIYPKDELLVLGTDELIEPVRFSIEKPPGLEQRFHGLEDYLLRSISIEAASPWNGKTLGELQVREIFGVMVVGIERGERRMMNPGSGDQIKAADLLWIVGEVAKLEGAIQASAAPGPLDPGANEDHELKGQKEPGCDRNNSTTDET